jgi:hypothetical protein
VDVNFTQTITFHSDDPDAMIALAREWDELQARHDIMGYMGLRILADREEVGRYVMIADFGAIDPDISAEQEAALNNARAETQEYSDRFRALSKEGEPAWGHYDELYRTPFV